uniref:Uncharacterized protein n=1 Tax=Avena sativa TaxID=4498 RepID=A0ACD5WKD4_AVESA
MEGPPKANTRRRQRLVERGSDRLAFITGQASALPSDPYSDSPLTSTASSHPSDGGFSTEKVSNFQRPEHRHQLSEIPPTGEYRQEKPKHKAHSSEGDLLQMFQINSAVPEIQPVYEPLLRSRDDESINRKTNDYVPASVQPPRRDVQPPRMDVETRPRSVPPSQPNQSDDSSWSLETLKQLVEFSPHEITQAISATEFNRLMASILIAFIVVLSNWGLDVGGIITRILVGTMPLVFLIITSITLVITYMMENKEARGRQGGGGLGSADGLVLMLELGSVLQKASEALLIDLSVCAVIMICFLGF